MTTKERNIIQTHFNKFMELDAQKDRCFKALQDLNAESGDGTRWCGVESNLRGVWEHGSEIDRNRALHLYRLYFEADAKEDLLRELGQPLADIGFWKSRS